MTRTILARKPYSSNPADSYLEIVMARIEKNKISHEFVTWVLNKQTNGYSHGHYYESDFKAALQDFNERGRV